MKNIGWYFYRNYLTDEVVAKIDQLKIRHRNQAKILNEEIQKVFDKQNKPILESIWDISEAIDYNKELTKILLKTTYPGLFSGSGIAHSMGEVGEFKLGFSFDHTTGQPYLAGSTVKGTLRSAFPFRLAQLASNEEDSKEKERMLKKAQALLDAYFSEIDSVKQLSPQQIFQLEWEIFNGEKIINMKDVWKDNKVESINFSNLKIERLDTYEHDIFHDAFISAGNSQGKCLGNDFITPHKHPDRKKKHLDALVNPTPIQFLKILPMVTFQFNFELKSTIIGDNEITATIKSDLFKHILLDFGIGAKTNVGYGQFSK